MATSIQFMGNKYASIEDMPPEVRQRYERMRDEVAKKYPDADADEALLDLLIMEEETAPSERGSKKHAWGGRQEKGSVPVPASFESTTDLGAAAKVYQVQRGGQQGLFFVLTIGFVMLIVALILGANSIQTFPSRDIDSISDGTIISGILSLILFGIGALLFLGSGRSVWSLWFGIQAVVVYRDGFAYRSGGRMTTFRWREIASIISNEETHVGSRGTGWTSRFYTIQKKSGEKVTLDNFQIEDVAALAKSIKENTYPLLLPPLTQKYNSNDPLAFGPVTIHRQNGIRMGGKQLAWDSIMDVKVKQGSLLVAMKDSGMLGGEHKVRASMIPNIEVLCEMIGVDPTSIELVG